MVEPLSKEDNTYMTMLIKNVQSLWGYLQTMTGYMSWQSISCAQAFVPVTHVNYWNEFLAVTSYPDEMKANLVTNSSGHINVTTCIPYTNYTSMEGLDLDKTMGVIENYFECSGICYPSHIRAFSDVTKYFHSFIE